MKKIYLFAIIFAVMAGIAVYLFASGLKNKNSAAAQPDTVNVLAAAVDIPQGSQITADMITAVSVPSASVPDKAVTDANYAVGKVAKYPISKGEQLLEGKLMVIGSETNSELAERIKSGYRAFTLSVDTISGLAGYLKVGDKVDIIVTMTIDEVSTTFYCLQNVNIIAVGSKSENGSSAYTNITVEISARDCLTLNYSMINGLIKLVLRGPGDDSIVSVPAVVK
jgi:pilus assembly protein CpaB